MPYGCTWRCEQARRLVAAAERPLSAVQGLGELVEGRDDRGAFPQPVAFAASAFSHFYLG
jgi:hypothetical protein